MVRIAEPGNALFTTPVHDVVILRPPAQNATARGTPRATSFFASPVIFSGALVGRARVADDIANRNPQAVGQGRVETGPDRGRRDDERIHIPIFRMVHRLRALRMHRRGQVLAKAPALGRPVVIDHTHLVVPEAIDPVFP
jgi:hypothetical protein